MLIPSLSSRPPWSVSNRLGRSLSARAALCWCNEFGELGDDLLLVEQQRSFPLESEPLVCGR